METEQFIPAEVKGESKEAAARQEKLKQMVRGVLRRFLRTFDAWDSVLYANPSYIGELRSLAAAKSEDDFEYGLNEIWEGYKKDVPGVTLGDFIPMVAYYDQRVAEMKAAEARGESPRDYFAKIDPEGYAAWQKEREAVKLESQTELDNPEQERAEL